MNAPVSLRRTSCDKKLSPVEKVPYRGHPLFSNTSSPYRFRPTPRAPFVSSTYVSIDATCSADECPFKIDEDGNPGGCFIEAGHFTQKMMKRPDGAAREGDKRDVIAAEVAEIDRAWPRGIPQDGARGGRDLRLHVGGETPDEWSAMALAGAAARWLSRGGGRVWSYTHSWRRIAPEAFWPISILASCETPRQVDEAEDRGYAPALVVDRFPNEKLPFRVGSTTFIPCPAETIPGKTCVTCRLCLSADDLFARGQGIAFQVHGQDSAAASAALVPLKTRRAA